MNTAANHIRLHFLKESDIRYVITKGGESPGVIPGYAEVWYNIRGRRRAHTDDLQKWILDVAKGAALMSQTRMEYQILASNYELLPSRPLAKTGLELMKLIGLPTLTEEDHKFGDPFVRSIGKEPFEGKFSYAGRLLPDPDFSKTFPNIFQTGGSNDVNNISWKILASL